MRYLILTLLFVSVASAEVVIKNNEGNFVLTKNSFKVSELLSDYARLESLNLSIDSDFRDAEFQAQGEMVINKEQMENYVSVLLSQSGNAVVRAPESPLYKVINARDTRYTGGAVYHKLDDIPHNDNQSQYSHQLKFIEANALARNLRPFMGRYGRIIDVVSSNTIHITDTNNNLIRLAKLIQMIDTEDFKKSTEEIRQINEKHKKILKNEKSVLDIFLANSGLFVLVFFILGSIIGFGTRGYMMKKVEGGLVMPALLLILFISQAFALEVIKYEPRKIIELKIIRAEPDSFETYTLLNHNGREMTLVCANNKVYDENPYAFLEYRNFYNEKVGTFILEKNSVCKDMAKFIEDVHSAITPERPFLIRLNVKTKKIDKIVYPKVDPYADEGEVNDLLPIGIEEIKPLKIQKPF